MFRTDTFINAPDGKTRGQIHHDLLHRTQNSSKLDVRSFWRAACDTDYFLATAKVRTRLSVSKQVAHKLDVGKFSPKQLSDLKKFGNSFRLKPRTGLQFWKT
jgi:hypothetical protein